MTDLSWTENFASIKSHKAFLTAKATFEAECKDKLSAKAFSYRQGKVSAECEAKPTTPKLNGKAMTPEQKAKAIAMLQSLLAC
jgi:hypothetical protein